MSRARARVGARRRAGAGGAAWALFCALLVALTRPATHLAGATPWLTLPGDGGAARLLLRADVAGGCGVRYKIIVATVPLAPSRCRNREARNQVVGVVRRRVDGLGRRVWNQSGGRRVAHREAGLRLWPALALFENSRPASAPTWCRAAAVVGCCACSRADHLRCSLFENERPALRRRQPKIAPLRLAPTNILGASATASAPWLHSPNASASRRISDARQRRVDALEPDEAQSCRERVASASSTGRCWLAIACEACCCWTTVQCVGCHGGIGMPWLLQRPRAP